MGLFDSIAGNLLGSTLGGQNSGALGTIFSQLMSGQHGDIGSMLSGMMNQAGGLPGLMQKAQELGIGDIVSSWVGTGQNAPISNDHVTSLLGSDTIQAVAGKFGVEASQITPLIASLLPRLVDKLTPDGVVDPEKHQGEALNDSVNGMLQGGGLSGILGSLLGR